MTGGRIILPPTNPSLDANGKPVSGSTLTYYQNGTTTPVSIYSNSALTIPLANPLTSDAAGVFPQVWAPNNAGYSVKWSRTGFGDVTFDNIFPDLDSSAVGTFVSLNQSQVSLGSNVNTSFGTAGVGLIENAFTQTDSTTGAGTVATAFSSVFGATTFATPLNAITITNAFGLYIKDPVAGAHVTLTNKWALGVDSLKVAGAFSAGIAGITGMGTGMASTFLPNGVASPGNSDTLVGEKRTAYSVSAGGSQVFSTGNGTAGILVISGQSGVGYSTWFVGYDNANGFVGAVLLGKCQTAGAVDPITSVVGNGSGNNNATVTVDGSGGAVAVGVKIIPLAR